MIIYKFLLYLIYLRQSITFFFVNILFISAKCK